MPRLKHRVPSFRLHKASGQAVVTLGGRDHYLGGYGCPESHEAYDSLIAEWLGNGKRVSQPGTQPDPNGTKGVELTINELLVAYWEFAEQYYVKNGKPSGELEPIRQSLKPLTRLYGKTLVSDFSPGKLRSVRHDMMEAGLCR